MSLISVKGLSQIYGRQTVLERVNLEIQAQEFCTIVGASGCGKSTFLRLLLSEERPTRGVIELDGAPLGSEPDADRGVVFQRYSVFPHLTVMENLILPLELRGAKFCGRLFGARRREAESEAAHLLERVGLSHARDAYPRTLSGGMQQRLAIAQALMPQPKVLLLDEPLSNLDARLRLEMRTELQRVQRDTGITMIFVTHDQSEALALADRIVLMKDGVIEQLGTADDLYNRPETEFAADFFGFENIFEVSGSSIRGPQGSVSISFTAKAGHLAWRPGAVKIGSGPHKATVRGVAFAGEHREYVFDTGLGQIKASAPAGEPAYELGASLSFDLPEDGALSIPAKN